jgi:glucan phosphoethanolaminetransferase (alkaline phosphatase superfamily)
MLALDSLFGLPAHIFLVHIPVVLIPLGALGAVLMLWPRLRSAIGWWVCGILVVAGIATQLAITSGKSLRNYVHETALVREHTRIGENIRPWLLFLFLVLLGVMLIDRAVRRRAERPAGRDALQIAAVVLSALSIVFAAVSVYWVYRIGHTGSKAVWHTTQVKIDKGQSNHEGGETREGHEGG